MISKYISTWWLVFFYIWLFGFLFKIKTITENINVYYITVLLFFGFMGVNFYYTQYLKRSFEPSMWLFLLYYHLVPLIFIIALNKRNHKNALATLVISVLIYLFHMTYIKESIYDTYFVKKIPKDWDEVNVRCKSEKNKDKIFCKLISYKQRFLEQGIL